MPRAINPGVAGSITVTGGASGAQVRAVRGFDLSGSQADSAGSIPVTRSTGLAQLFERVALRANYDILVCAPDTVICSLVKAQVGDQSQPGP